MMGPSITLSLISHTNVGKTTLARTLLRQDVGEVLDQAHVTEASAAYTLLEAPAATLRLWDTPGFGNTHRLMARLRREREPLGWLLHQVWDRVVDRPLYCSQRAVRNIKEEADVVLYLVNASEEPEEAGYVAPELEILTWMDRPVLLLLNQVGDDGAELVSRWSRFVERWPVVRDVLSLDAFSRCWTEEGALLQRIVVLLDGDDREIMDGLAAAWIERNLAVFRSCCARMAHYLAGIAVDREVARPGSGDDTDDSGVMEWLTDLARLVKQPVDKKRSMAALTRRLDAATGELMNGLIAAHGLDGKSGEIIERRVQDYQIKGATAFTERSGAVTGAVVSGALGGLAADVLSGGLSLGGGMIAGGILGALGGSALVRGYRWIGGAEEPRVTWTPEFLDQLVRQVMLRYLAVAHFGRGRGAYEDLERPAHWSASLENALASKRPGLHESWRAAETATPETADRIGASLERTIDETLRQVLRDAYPEARRMLT